MSDYWSDWDPDDTSPAGLEKRRRAEIDLAKHKRYIEATNPGLRAERIKQRIVTKQLPIMRMQAQTEAVRAGIAKGSFTIDVMTFLKPILIGALLLFFFIGPGITAFAKIFQATTWWFWAIFIFVCVLLWRRR